MAGTEELTRWLETKGLGACARLLIDNAIDLDLLPELTDKDLASIGLVLGLRRNLLKAVAELRNPAATKEPAATAVAAAPPIAVSSAAPVAPTGERRHMAVMFCHLVDTTGAAESLDSEDRLDLFAAFLKPVTDSVARFGGHVAKTLGDGMMVYFGYPEAQENDAERAVRAGLAIHEAITALAAHVSRTGMPPLAARVGLHAGLVVVADGADAFGDVPNVASRVETATKPGQTMISGAVHRAVAGLFVVEDKGPHTLKGVPVPMTLFRVVRATSPRRRHRWNTDPTPLVGRDEEVRLVANRWDRVLSGEGQLVTIVGEPGLGKTRLIDDFQSRLTDTPHTLVEWTCAQLLQNTPLNPLMEWARYRFGGPEIPVQQRVADLEGALAAVKLDAAELLPVLAPLFDMTVSDQDEQSQDVVAVETRSRQLAALVKWVMAAARDQPVIIVVEDAHWADPSTLDMVRALVERNEMTRLMVIITARPEFRAPWPVRSHHTQITLVPLARTETQRMVANLTAQHAIGNDLAEIVVRRTGGVPQFIEEVTRLLVETQGRAGPRAIPSSLAASLTARLDQLGHGKKVAQIGAMLGREFGWRLLRSVSGMSDDVLQTGLAKLVDANLLQTQGVPPESVYRFKNALLQDAARDGLLRPQARELHNAAARALSDEFPDIVAAQPELLAHHLTEAGQADAAVVAWESAGLAATARGAFPEAGADVRRAIDVLLTTPDVPARVAKEFELRARLAECYWASKGQSAPETMTAFEEALAVGERVGDSKALAMILSGLISATNQRAEFDIARAFGDRLSALAQRNGGAFERGWASFRRGQTRIYTGDLIDARLLYDEALALGDGEDRLVAGGVELVGAVTVFSPWLHALLGEIDRGRDEARARLRAAEKSGGPHNRAHVRLGAALYCLSVGDAARVEEHAAILLSEGNEYRMPIFVAYATLLLGSAATGLGRPAEAVEHLTNGMEMLAAVGTKTMMNVNRARLAQAMADNGELEMAIAMIEGASTLGHTGPFMAPEVLRIKGELLLRRAGEGDSAAAEGAFAAGLEDARRMKASLLELQLATALARMRMDSGDEAGARDVLASVYAKFAQGFDTAHLRDAAKLLDRPIP